MPSANPVFHYSSVVWFLRSEVSFRDKMAFDEISPLEEELVLRAEGLSLRSPGVQT